MRRSFGGWLRIVIIGVLAACGTAFAGPMPKPGLAAGAADPAAEFFENHVRPVLANSCFSCHGPQAQMAGLRLDSRAAMLKGADADHHVLVPGDPAHSALATAIAYTGAIKMPPTGKLTPAEITALTEWIRMGAPWPDNGPMAPAGLSARERAWKTHWAFQPVRDPSIPRVKHPGWVKSPIDAFILKKLEEKGMTPSKPADRLTLIRRATFDLIGLPPSPAEVDAFLRDRSPNAFEKVVDRLLASPHYGERWGRYWLDVARYADTKGYLFQEDRDYHYAYTYRDWVIRAFNEDLPYDQFLKEQIAADLLPNRTDPRTLAALGFLTLGRRFLNNPPDIIDDRIDVVCRGTMALTVTCARCHDHKFDPIPTADYYSLYGVFASSEEPKELPVIASPAQQEANNLYASELKRREDALAQFATANKPQLTAGNAAARASLAGLQRELDNWKAHPAPDLPRAMALQDAAAPITPHIFHRGNPNNPGDAVPRHFLTAIAGPSPKPFVKGSGRLELAEDIASPTNPLTARTMVNRVWLHHFGYGLVRTPSDFGMRSDPPTHPEMLDYLAWRFSHEGWSIKKLQRLIMLSSVYQQSSDDNPHDRALDPENLLLWRMNRQRLDFEATRDSILAVSGELDPAIGGPGVDIVGAAYSPRRTVYGYIDRQNLPGLFRTFDFASPDSTSPQRHVTTVPQQALFMMNSPFVVDAARRLAARPDAPDAEHPAARIRFLYRLLFGRAPSAGETTAGLRFLRLASLPDPGPPPEPASAWQYGYGEYDAAAGRLKSFHPLPRFVGQAWQGGPVLPDPQLGWVTLNAAGGHPGNDLQHAAIRRWVAPADGIVSISGILAHGQAEGDGVEGRIVSSRSGDLGHWIVHNSRAETDAAGAVVRRGDTIDFVLDCRTNPGFDSFSWAPTIHLNRSGTIAASAGAAPAAVEWNAAADFGGPPPALKDLSAWDQYAQVLLMTNEFVFVD